MMKFYLHFVCTISLIFKIYFPEIPWEIVFGVTSSSYLYLWLLENAERFIIYFSKTRDYDNEQENII